jgi:DNA-binding LytR/AlgR family response regulator
VLLYVEVVFYWALLGAGLARQAYREAHARELQARARAAQLQEARLLALKQQIHPHFPFNALNTVAMLVRNGECANGRQALGEIAARQPNLVLLDIQMPDLNGFEVLAALDLARATALIFVTAYDQYALRAFEMSALDYLLKPFTDQRFIKPWRAPKPNTASARRAI